MPKKRGYFELLHDNQPIWLIDFASKYVSLYLLPTNRCLGYHLNQVTALRCLFQYPVHTLTNTEVSQSRQLTTVTSNYAGMYFMI